MAFTPDDPYELHTLLNQAVADANAHTDSEVAGAAAVRQIQTFKRGTLAELEAVAEVEDGDQGYVTTGADAGEYLRSGGAWVRGGAFTAARAFTNTSNTIVSVPYATLPTAAVAVTVVAPAACKARIDLSVLASAAAGFINVGVAVSGATTLAANHDTSGVVANATEMTIPHNLVAQYQLAKIVDLNAGSNTFTVQAHLGGAGGLKVLSAVYLSVSAA